MFRFCQHTYLHACLVIGKSCTTLDTLFVVGNISPRGLAVMESILSGNPGVVVYIDNVLVTRNCEEKLVLSLNT